VKYIVYKNNGEEFIITFSGKKGQPQHKDVAEALGLTSIVAAGMFMEVVGRKIFNGESMTLNIKSRGDVDRDLYIEQCRR
jgi:hypothetical protein